MEGPFEAWPYQVAWLDCMGNDDIRRVTIIKCGRIGYTKCLAAATGYMHHHKRRNVVIYLPTDSEAKEFAKDTIDPMLRDSPALSQLMRSSGRNNKENTLDQKYFYGSSLHIRGGKAAGNFRRLTKDTVVYDELDGFDADIDGEGDPLSLGDKRVRDSSFPKSIRGSTPTIAGQSLIERSSGEADLLFRYKVPCPHCGLMQSFKWGGRETPFGMKWDGDDYRSAHYVCEGCQGRWEYSELWTLLEGGRWETDDGAYYIDAESDLRDGAGELVPWPNHIAFQIWAAYSLTFPWPDIVHEFIESKDDAVKLKAFVNMTLGECWKEQVQEVDHAPLLDRREQYETVPDDVLVLTAGVDVQMDRFEWEVVGWGAGEESWSVDYQRLYGDMQSPKTWAALQEMLRRRYRRANGSEMAVRLVCMDSGYLAEEVYAFSKRVGLQWLIPTKGQSVMGKPIAVFPRRPNAKGVYLTELGSDNAKETIYQRLALTMRAEAGARGAGICHFPDSLNHDEEYFLQLTGEVKRPKRNQGRTTFFWTQKYGRVEALDCRVNALAAVRILQERFGVRLKVRAEALTPKHDAPEPPDSPAPQKPKSRRSQSSWVNRRGKWI